jgi:hypothetical protein
VRGFDRSRALIVGNFLLQVINEENRAINNDWKPQPARNQQIKPHALTS